MEHVRVPQRLSYHWWEEWHVVQLGWLHVDRHVKVHVARYVGESPHNAPFSTCTCVRTGVDKLKLSLGVPQCEWDTWLKIVPWHPPIWVRHVSVAKRRLLPPRRFVKRHVASGCVSWKVSFRIPRVLVPYK